MSYSYRPVYIGCNQVVFYFEKTNLLWKVTFVAGVLNVIGNIVFVPIFGVNAAALVTFATLMYMGFSGFFFKVIKTHNKAKLYPLVWFILIISCTSLAIIFYDSNILLKFVINAVMVVVLFLMQKITTAAKRGSQSVQSEKPLVTHE
jgi:O-antigen/teichoic acid export membrane protein